VFDFYEEKEMRVIITGGSGMLGSRLASSWANDGYEVVVLSRNPGKHPLPQGVRADWWDAHTAEGWGRLADGAFAILNLAGESLSGSGLIPSRWTAARKRRIQESRRHAGQAVTAAVEAATNKPEVVYQMSGVDYYPPGEQMMTEQDAPGNTFLSHVVADYWEPPTAAVQQMDVRRVIGRTAVVLNLENGPLPLSVLQFRLFVGGRLGSGEQWFPWVHENDVVRAIRFLVENEAAQGVYNIVAPEAVTNNQYTKALGRVMHRPSLIPVPAFALKAALGEVAALVLDGRPVSPQKLLDLGFEFHFPRLESALRDVLQ
jgi:uncharacterized protein (TIGR01777 family)